MPATQFPAATPSAPIARQRPPQVVGPWRLVRLLGEGEWCQVFQASPLHATEDSSADYAVKLLRDSQRDNRHAIAQLQNEAFAARSVVHPHVTCHLSSHVDRPPFYLVMPYHSGMTLRQHLRLATRLSLAQSLWNARQVAEGLAALHDQGWVHRDVKPDNVRIAANGHATLCDLGLACRLNRTLQPVDSVVGTPAYMSPESFAGVGLVTPAMDCYSLGIVLYEMLTGERPFPQEDAAELFAAHRLLRPPDPRRLRPDVPTHVAQLIRHMLAKEPLRRPAGSELINCLVDSEIDAFEQRQAA